MFVVSSTPNPSHQMMACLSTGATMCPVSVAKRTRSQAREGTICTLFLRERMAASDANRCVSRRLLRITSHAGEQRLFNFLPGVGCCFQMNRSENRAVGQPE